MQLESFHDSLPMRLYRALDAVMPAFRQVFSEFGLTEQQWRVLRVLWEQGAVPLSSLASATLIPAPSLVGVVDRLTRNGLVARERSTDDRRVVYIQATEQGRSLEASVRPKVDEVYAQLMDQVDPELWRELNVSLDQVTESLSQSPRDERSIAPCTKEA